ncbi:MAG TPA: hypothetical protein VE988_10565, partial [Gemmataceae bacterium]|nr:hypothetical protein [Gemmataceae bacterium]
MPRRIIWFTLAGIATAAFLAFTVQADTLVQGEGLATCVKVEGALVEETKAGFKQIKPGQKIPAETLVVGLPEADLVTSDGKCEIRLLVYIGEELPVTEAAVIFHTSVDKVPEFTLDRGVVAVKNVVKAEKGVAVVRIRAGKQSWEITLRDPGSEVLVARFGRHEPGTKLFQGGPKKEFVDEPQMHFGVLVVKGHAVVNTGTHTYAMTAPPGPAMAAWDSATGLEIKRLESMPEEVRNLEPAETEKFKEICVITSKLASGDIGKGIDELLASDNVSKRRVAVACMGAFDDLPRLWAAMENAKHEDVREQAIHTMRNWIGRKPGQLTKLQDQLTKEKKYSAVQIRTITTLLRGFDDTDRREPVIYQLLIDSLEVAPLPIRQLAHWHLERLAPAGQKIAYDAGADEAARR